MLNKRAILLSLILPALLAACATGVPDLDETYNGWCYTFNLAYEPLLITFGTQDSRGISTVDGTLSAIYTHPMLVEATYLEAQIFVDVQYGTNRDVNADFNIFGIAQRVKFNTNNIETTVSGRADSAGLATNTASILIATESVATVTIRSLTVAGTGLNPFPRDDCGNNVATSTPLPIEVTLNSPTPTLTPSPTYTPSATTQYENALFIIDVNCPITFDENSEYPGEGSSLDVFASDYCAIPQFPQAYPVGAVLNQEPQAPLDSDNWHEWGRYNGGNSSSLGFDGATRLVGGRGGLCWQMQYNDSTGNACQNLGLGSPNLGNSVSAQNPLLNFNEVFITVEFFCAEYNGVSHDPVSCDNVTSLYNATNTAITKIIYYGIPQPTPTPSVTPSVSPTPGFGGLNPCLPSYITVTPVPSPQPTATHSPDSPGEPIATSNPNLIAVLPTCEPTGTPSATISATPPPSITNTWEPDFTPSAYPTNTAYPTGTPYPTYTPFPPPTQGPPPTYTLYPTYTPFPGTGNSGPTAQPSSATPSGTDTSGSGSGGSGGYTGDISQEEFDGLLGLLEDTIGGILGDESTERAFGVGVNAWNSLTGWLGWGVDTVTIIGNLWSNTPAALAPPGMPRCISDTAVQHEICAIYYILENTLFTGVGVAIIPLIVAAIDIAIFASALKYIKSIAQWLREIIKGL